MTHINSHILQQLIIEFSLLWIVGNVIIHHNNNPLIRNSMVVNNVICMTNVSLQDEKESVTNISKIDDEQYQGNCSNQLYWVHDTSMEIKQGGHLQQPFFPKLVQDM